MQVDFHGSTLRIDYPEVVSDFVSKLITNRPLPILRSAIFICLGAATTFVQFVMNLLSKDEMVAGFAKTQPDWSPEKVRLAADQLFVFTAFQGVVIISMWLFMAFAVLRPFSWVILVGTTMAVFSVASSVMMLTTGGFSLIGSSLMLLGTLSGVAATWYMWRPPARAFIAAERLAQSDEISEK